MVLPIVAGVVATVFALGAKATISAYRKYLLLTPAMIAALNNIQLKQEHRISRDDPYYSELQEVLRRFPESSGFLTKMNEKEALDIFGFSAEDIQHMDHNLIRQRYRKLMVVNHPDKNGSQYLSQKINQAKEVLDKSYMTRDR